MSRFGKALCGVAIVLLFIAELIVAAGFPR
jgi:hypothetical protein